VTESRIPRGSQEATPEIQLLVNGEPRTVSPGLTVRGLLESFGLTPATIVVERNRAILDRAKYEDTVLYDGDRLELVHFVGGG
jgi:thiamine biosynthesis protein ThiS